MAPHDLGLRVAVVDNGDDDYLGVEIYSTASRFAGTTQIFIGSTELGEFAAAIAGFPRKPDDSTHYMLGTTDRQCAGGFCELRLDVDATGQVLVTVHIEDDNRTDCARFSFRTEAAMIDRFALELRSVGSSRSGEASLSRVQ